ncbi:MAG: PhnD/SsuA/transferrin family substrate-binding protein, partial [Boseongicola sp.]|nr:PhnD/SsuA/transferrin family substrate-binding protein [Boseongicola sp.]
MYWFAETKAAHVAFWALVRNHLETNGVKAPKNLSEMKSPYEVWGAPDLVLSHICHLPYRLQFKDAVTRIAASDYGLKGCPSGHYRSLFVVREDHQAETPQDLDGMTMALNSEDSHSGWGDAASWALANNVRFRPSIWTGSHQKSLRAVVAQEADFATIDAQTFEILKRIDPATSMVRVIGETEPSPGMTFITARGNDPEPFRKAI